VRHGPYGYQWFSLQDRTPSVMLAGVQATAPILNAFIDAERDQLGWMTGRWRWSASRKAR